MHIQLAKWGNSLAVRIPKSALEVANLKEGDTMELLVNDAGEMLLKPGRRKKYTLEELVSQITPKNCHEGTDWGDPLGDEAW